MKTRKIFAGLLSFLLATAVITCFCFFAITIEVNKINDDVWKQLGLTMPDANRNITNSVLRGSLYYFGAKNASKIAAGNRAALIKEMFAYAKKYSSSPDFKASYKKAREEARPKLYELPGATPEAVRARERKRLEENLKTAQEGLNSTNPKIKNGAPTRIENIKKEIAALDDPENKTIKRLIENERSINESVIQQNEQATKKFEDQYPEDPQLLIRKRLEEILKVTGDVDYAAELKDVEWQGKKFKVFINPEYEKRSKEWKLAFRAGKPPTDAVRAAAETWLKEFK
jgi:hypothetical protein